MPSITDVTDRSPEYDRRIDEWRKVRAVIEGEDEIKRRSTEYLPQPTGQTNAAYRRYIDRSVFYGVCDRTIRGLVGLVFRIEPTPNLPTRLDYLNQAASPDGDPLDVLLREATRELVSLGRYGLLVDMGQEPANIAEAQPFIAPYKAEAIWRWDEELDPRRGRRHTTRVVVEEDPASEGDHEVKWVRELYLDEESDADGSVTSRIYRQQLWRSSRESSSARGESSVSLTDDSESRGFERVGDPITPLMNGKPLDFIPFVFANTFNLLPRPDKAPMLDLANMNLAHWRNSADYEQLLHLVGSPTPWMSGNFSEKPVPNTIGAGARWELPEGAQAGILEFSGESATAFVEAMKDKEDRMAALGARLIQDHERSNITAETTRMQTESETSVLGSAVSSVEAAFAKAIRLMALWTGASEGEIETIGVDMNHDFVGATLSSNDLKELVAAWQSGAISKKTLHENLQRGEIIDPKRTFEEEQDLIDSEGVGMTGAEPTTVVPPDEEDETSEE